MVFRNSTLDKFLPKFSLPHHLIHLLFILCFVCWLNVCCVFLRNSRSFPILFSVNCLFSHFALLLSVKIVSIAHAHGIITEIHVCRYRNLWSATPKMRTTRAQRYPEIFGFTSPSPRKQWLPSPWRSLFSATIPTSVRSSSPPLAPRAGLSGLARTAAWRRWPFPEPCAPPRRSTTFSKTGGRCRAKASIKRRTSSCESVS